MEKSSLFINGEWIINDNQTFFESINPATKEVIGSSCLATEEQVDLAVQAANNAYNEWKLTPSPTRANYLSKISSELKKRRKELAEMMTMEMGKVLKESIGEVDVILQHIEYMHGEAKRLIGEIVPSSSPNRTIQMVREPLGVVACITPWNFPVVLAAYKIFSALITGNTVVWKPASEVALSAEIFTEVIEQSGIPKGVFNLVTGSGQTVGNKLATHENVNIIAFTGSTNVGKKITEMGSNTLKRVSLELGGKNAVIVLRDANLEEAANGIIQSAFTTTGQRCTAASRIIVERSVKAKLIDLLVERTKEMNVGNGLVEESDIGPVVNESQLETIESYVHQAVQEGGKVEIGGKRGSDLEGYFYEPTIISNVKPTDTIAHEEIFGPVLAVLEVDSYEEAMKINNDTIYGLSTSIYTNSLHFANKASREAVSGLVYINSGTSNAEIGVAFGGMKMSGNGHREVSNHSFDLMTEWKSIYTNY
ncbi:aldehyde dehydrogenase family protein [Pseudogracilibacillus auburnensis]|uniref:3-sulfolactaldehyde dehydrogenase n=1 Tax=Pseudogracilibacillus auburnensis TaxID=1494959 RepID=A0A2V3W486_9BACI|nr:aldehyde dehydrogenase family protein [Pseudogracilibacillus auburnensis]MBO1002775.1 aldehyde dehydrogenase family protein [Pseudogracilibacillus auburnensis]PXW87888.1 aldehyde dehydrogenase (NAD+) [Pseudogracilibacillus auburnensis]